MTVLVTGGSGFLGTYLVRRLLLEGFVVRATYRRAPVPILGVQWWHLPDLDSPEALAAAVEGCEAVVHLAALAHQMGRSGKGRAHAFLHVNTEGTRLLAGAAARAGVRRFIFLSSLAAVCSRSDLPVSDDTTCAPGDDYGRSKLQAEVALVAELHDTPVDWCILRPPLVYGPGAPGNVGRMMRLVASGLPLPLRAIRNKRSFIYVGNLVDAIVAVLRHEGSILSSYVLADGSDFATPELATALARACGLPVRLLSVPVGVLRLIGRGGDLVAALLGTATAWDSYSVDRLIGSLPVDGKRFRDFFNWCPPTSPTQALRLTCQPAVS